ncbi:MAG: OB-fold domain-containing protein [Spirochaetes bacterium]|nr:OB-fold domain-containing protein [Spirochaetota bacterium]MBU1081381.1 OB-fold domain-containing protein [Spirochaetota bacterium]
MNDQFPEILPRLESYNTMRTWRERFGRYLLQGSRCKSCGSLWFPRRDELNCPKCKGMELEPYRCSRLGTIDVVQVENMGYPIMGYGETAPRLICTIRLDDGITVISELVDAEKDELVPGARVRMVLRKHKREETGAWMYGYMFALCRE